MAAVCSSISVFMSALSRYLPCSAGTTQLSSTVVRILVPDEVALLVNVPVVFKCMSWLTDVFPDLNYTWINFIQSSYFRILFIYSLWFEYLCVRQYR